MCDEPTYPDASPSLSDLRALLGAWDAHAARIDLAAAEAVVHGKRVDIGAAVAEAYLPWTGEPAWMISPWFAQAVRDWFHAWSHFAETTHGPASVDLRAGTVTWGSCAIDIDGQLAATLGLVYVGAERHQLRLPARCPSWCPGPPQPDGGGPDFRDW